MLRNKLLAIAFTFLSISNAAFATDKGLFWRLESPKGVVSYLFGTIHSDDSRVSEISPNMLAAMTSVDTFMMEAGENRDPSVMLLKEGNLASQLTEAEFEKCVSWPIIM